LKKRTGIRVPHEWETSQSIVHSRYKTTSSNKQIPKQFSYLVIFLSVFIIGFSVLGPIYQGLRGDFQEIDSELTGRIAFDLSYEGNGMELSFEWYSNGTAVYRFENDTTVSEKVCGDFSINDQMVKCFCENETLSKRTCVIMQYTPEENEIYFCYQKEPYDISHPEDRTPLFTKEMYLRLSYEILSYKYTLTTYNQTADKLIVLEVQANVSSNTIQAEFLNLL
jgi:hypothetical protein